jgi:hypothetical protein
MSLLDKLYDVILNLPANAVLRHRLANCEALKEQLQSELASCKDDMRVAKKQLKAAGLIDTEKVVLLMLLGSYMSLTKERFYELVNMTRVRIDYHLHELESTGYIELESTERTAISSYSLTQSGREYLLANGYIA